MISVGRWVKVWVFVSLVSLLLWLSYWLLPSFGRFLSMDGTPWAEVLRRSGLMFTVMELSWAVGTIARFFGVLVGIGILVILVLKPNKELYSMRKWIALALSIEAFYYGSVAFPSGLVLVGVGRSAASLNNFSLGIAYLLQGLFTVPFLAILAVKVGQYKKLKEGFRSMGLVGLAFAGYVVALWANVVFRWVDMVAIEGFGFFSIGLRTIGSLTAFIIMSLALIFSLVGAYSLAKRRGSALKWLGLALAMVGLYYLTYLLYSYYSNMMGWVWLVDVWTIPLLGLGITLLVTKTTRLPQRQFEESVATLHV
jgi:hypothetical protein